ncbi:site-specific integrase [Geomobilimonas luticola]|uniref:Site-specific integrase n=1 Tax=Geomobilimonas luticola TaxID=1114878 RepID=A0ABS5S8Z5_9BACT|nr:site-specific integrase [Geomobilimonas luticola]MBT0651844.1 site-specific integrase [Geomobilimonas luticola]
MSSTYLLKIGVTYYFRCRIPKDLLPYFKTFEIKKSLRTSCHRSAKAAVKSYAYQLERIFSLVRTGMIGDMQLQTLLERYKVNSLPSGDCYDANDSSWNAVEFNDVCRKVLPPPKEVDLNNQRPPFPLSKAIDKFCKDRQKERPTNERTQQRYREYFNVMLGMLGDRDVTEYNRRDLENLKDELYERPKNLSKGQKNAPPLDKRTVNTNYIGKIVSLFKWLHVKDYVDRDLTPGLASSLTSAEKKARKRRPYDPADLKRIFDLLPFEPKQPHLAWVPLIAAYSGARQGEICQLLVTDIKEADGIPYMHITEEDDAGNLVKTVKNENSKRVVPIHPAIIEMGFLDFVERQRGRGKTTVFETTTGKPLTGQYYSKRFQQFNNQFVTADRKKVFHSFRHTVDNQLKQLMIPDNVRYSIIGHMPENAIDDTYTQEYLVHIKYNELIKLEHPSINLKELKKRYAVFHT